jgi:hypothetical protein
MQASHQRSSEAGEAVAAAAESMHGCNDVCCWIAAVKLLLDGPEQNVRKPQKLIALCNIFMLLLSTTHETSLGSKWQPQAVDYAIP